MAKIPSVAQIRTRLPTARGGIPSADLGAVARAEGELAQAESELGRGIQALGAGFRVAEKRRAEFDRIQAESEFLKGLLEEKDKASEDPEWEGMTERFMGAASERLTLASEKITDDREREIFRARSSVDLERARISIDNLEFSRESDFQTAKLTEDIQSLKEAAHMSLDEEEMGRYILAITERIDSHNEMGFFGANGDQKAEKLRRTTVNKFAIDQIQMAEPEQQLEMLKGDMRSFITAPQAKRLEETANELLEKKQKGLKEDEGYQLAKEWLESGINLSEMPSEADKIKDPEVRDFARDEYTRRYKYMEKAGKDFQESLYQNNARLIDNGEISYEQIPRDQIDSMTIQQTDALKKRDYALRTETVPTKSNRVVLDTLISFEENQQWDDARDYFVKNSHLLSDTDYKAFSRSTQERKTPPELKPLYTNQQRLTNKMKEAKIPKGQLDEVKNMMGDWYQNYLEVHEKPPTAKEFDAQADEFLMKMPETFWEGWFSDTRGFETEFALEEAVLQTVDQSELNRLSEAYRAGSGREPTPKELLDYYKWAKSQGLAK